MGTLASGAKTLGNLQDVIDIETDLSGIQGSWVAGAEPKFAVVPSGAYVRPGTDHRLTVHSYVDGGGMVLLRFYAGIASSGLWRVPGWLFAQYAIDNGWELEHG